MHNNKVAIIGLGLIGSSLGMALRNAPPVEPRATPLHITGYDQDRRATSTARGRLAIDREATTLADAVRDASLVVLATPVHEIPVLFAQLAPLLSEGVVLTDTASTKAQVCAWARDMLPAGLDFVGGHPMAGSEQSGPAAAAADLFAGAIYCLTPDTQTRPHALHTVEAMVQAAGAKPYYIDPHEHDAYVAGVSHLPMLLSATLVEAVSRSAAWKEMAPLAASGFRDVSRLAAGDPTMHRGICLSNREALLRWLTDTIGVLDELRATLEQEDAARHDAQLPHAQQVRHQWQHSAPNMRPGEDHYTQVPQVERGFLGLPRRPRKQRP
jgi:prephenate dehydrogenase